MIIEDSIGETIAEIHGAIVAGFESIPYVQRFALFYAGFIAGRDVESPQTEEEKDASIELAREIMEGFDKTIMMPVYMAAARKEREAEALELAAAEAILCG